MLKTKLATTLRALSSAEWAQFKKYFLGHTSEDTNLYSLFDFYYSNRSRLEKVQEKDLLALQKFLGLTAKGLSNLSSKLLQEVDAWLLLSELYRDPYLSDIKLVKALNKRGVYSRADQVAKRLETRINNAETINHLQTEALAHLYSAQYYSNNPIKRSKGSTLFSDCVSKFALNAIEQASKLRLELANSSKARNISYHQEKEVLDKMGNLSEGTELTRIFKLTLAIIEDSDLDAFMDLKSILERGLIDPTTDLELILVSYLNNCTVFLYQKNIIPAYIVVDITQIKFACIERHATYKLLPINFFSGLHAVANYLTYEETASFIDKWKDNVYTKHYDSVCSYAMAINELKHDRYDKLPELINGLEFDDFTFKLESIAVLVMAFYKLGEEDLMTTLLRNLKRQIKRYRDSEISEFARIGLLNLMEVILLFQKSKYDRSVKIDINEHHPLYFKSWVEKEMKSRK